MPTATAHGQATSLLGRITPAAEAVRRAVAAVYSLAAPPRPTELPPDKPALLRSLASALTELEKACDGLGVRDQAVLLLLAAKLA
jgi:hypothetical protein